MATRFSAAELQDLVTQLNRYTVGIEGRLARAEQAAKVTAAPAPQPAPRTSTPPVTVTDAGIQTLPGSDSGVLAQLKRVLRYGFKWSGQKCDVKPEPNMGISVDAGGVAVVLKPAGGIDVDATGLHLVQQATLTPASAISAISLGAGGDTVDRATFNTDLAAMRTELNAFKTKINDIITKLENGEFFI